MNKLLPIAAVSGLLALSGVLMYRGRAPRLSHPESGSAADAAARRINAYNAELRALARIDESLVLYREVEALPVPGLESLVAIAVDARDRIYVGGGSNVVALASRGNDVRRLTVDADVTCVASDHAGRLYVGMGNAVRVFDRNGDPTVRFDDIPGDAIITSIAAAEDDVFVADAQSRTVMRFSPDGILKHVIDGRQGGGDADGFVVPSPYFDVMLGQGQTLWIVNPGRHRLEEYNYSGDRIGAWQSQPGMDVEHFCGCCNPSHAAQLSDGAIVTSERGLPRVKLYTRRGRFAGVVAVPGQFANRAMALDLAVDSNDRILIADPARMQVRIFERKAP